MGGQERRGEDEAEEGHARRDPAADLERIDPGLLGVDHDARVPGLLRDGERGTDGVAGGLEHRGVRDGVVERVAVDRQGHAADHGDAQGPAELTRRVVDGGADAGLGRGDDAHDRLGGGRAGEAHAQADRHHLADDREVLRVLVAGGDPVEAADEEQAPRADDELGPEPDRERGADQRADGDRDGDRDLPEAGFQHAPPEHELRELTDQEDEAEQREERERDGAGRRREAQVREQPDVEHRDRDVALPDRERGEQAGRGAEVAEAGG